MSLVPQVEFLEFLLRPTKGLAAFYAVITGLVGNNLNGLFEHVEIEFLRYQSNTGLGCSGVGLQVVAKYGDTASRFIDQ